MIAQTNETTFHPCKMPQCYKFRLKDYHLCYHHYSLLPQSLQQEFHWRNRKEASRRKDGAQAIRDAIEYLALPDDTARAEYIRLKASDDVNQSEWARNELIRTRPEEWDAIFKANNAVKN